MGWTEYHADCYKNGLVDRKAECDKIFNDSMVDIDSNKIGKFEVVKSSMVGSTYYAAVRRTKFATETTPETSQVFAVICLTSVNNKKYYNFAYKDMDETCGPYECKCPKAILNLLSETDHEWSKQWRERCWEYHKSNNSPNALGKLPVGSVIEWTCKYEMMSGHKPGDKIRLTKRKGWKQSYWTDGRYKYKTTLFRNSYVIISKGE